MTPFSRVNTRPQRIMRLIALLQAEAIDAQLDGDHDRYQELMAFADKLVERRS